ncbi:Hypothetical protein CAP_6859 [Chondromyces apiculatus DSM 436]|uniref:Uncharacterized protein n=1 Tax=Chondromyces apiculatus DSM 436 TaxID=1192034 RepID=A0A017TFY3_9BACT|nr:Hypothetical protein CAP_6859 [Chondromyces apiculatus DSM 436]
MVHGRAPPPGEARGLGGLRVVCVVRVVRVMHRRRMVRRPEGRQAPQEGPRERWPGGALGA